MYGNTFLSAKCIKIYSRYGVLKGIINDCNPLFINKFWNKLYDITEIKYKLLTAYYPQTDSQTERIN